MEQPRSKSTVYISKFYKIRIAWRKLHQSPYLSHYRNSVNNCFLAQNFTEIGQSGAELWPKTIFKMAVIRHEFETFSYLVIWLSSSSKCAVMHPVSSKLDDFCRAMLCIRAAYAVMRCPSVTFMDCARGIVLLKTTTDRHEASRDPDVRQTYWDMGSFVEMSSLRYGDLTIWIFKI